MGRWWIHHAQRDTLEKKCPLLASCHCLRTRSHRGMVATMDGNVKLVSFRDMRVMRYQARWIPFAIGGSIFRLDALFAFEYMARQF
jgi:hypothetical protein